MKILAIKLLGPFRATLDGEPLSGFDSNKVRALLAYLAVEIDRPHPREKLAGLLWPDFSERSARTNLRGALANLRQVIRDKQADPTFLLITRGSIQFNPLSNHELDVCTFQGLLVGTKDNPVDVSNLDEALSLYHGDFLEGFSIPDSPPFEQWVLVTREMLRGETVRSLYHLASFFEKQGAYERALGLAQRQVTLDPYQEAAHQQVMRLLALSGQRNEALAHYEQLRHLLERELGVAPSPQTQELHDGLLKADLPPTLPPPQWLFHQQLNEVGIDSGPQTEAAVSPVRFFEASLERTQRPSSKLGHQLPAQVTSFVGRKRELSEIEQLLETVRLITLVGAPGTGKTRLALEVAANVLDDFADGIFFVDLAPISDPQLVTGTITHVLGIRETAGQTMIETLKNYFQMKHLLLLLDNFEQIIIAAPLASNLLASAPGLKILVTSREPLHIYGEQEYYVPPLTVPEIVSSKSLLDLAQIEAVELFLRRAQAVKREFVITKENAPAIAEICLRLDGLPLAIELAAARVKLFTPEMIRARLKSRFATLTGGSRDLPVRLQTLKAAIDWSYELLDDSEKKLFWRLAVFQGGRSIPATEAVCTQGLDIDVLDGLESLFNKSLLQPEQGSGGKPRFTMLETIHEYARERLKESGEERDLKMRHADYFVTLLERAEPELYGDRSVAWFTLLREELDNIRTALTWSLEDGDATIALRMASSLREYWYGEGNIAEGLMWNEQALEAAPDAPTSIQLKALNAAGFLAFIQGDLQKGKDMHLEAVALSRDQEDWENLAFALVFLALDETGYSEEYEEGITNCEEALRLFRELDNKPGMVLALTMLGELARLIDDNDQARLFYEECLAVSHEIGHRWREAMTLGNLAAIEQRLGNYDQAEALLLKELELTQKIELNYLMVLSIPLLAGPAVAKGKFRRAARLLGASEAILESMGARLFPVDQLEVDRYIVALREQLDEETHTTAWAKGKAMTLEQAVAYALSDD